MTIELVEALIALGGAAIASIVTAAWKLSKAHTMALVRLEICEQRLGVLERKIGVDGVTSVV